MTIYAKSAEPPQYAAARRDMTERLEAETWLNALVARAKRVGKFAEFCDITPSRAGLLLERNPGNRRLTKSGVEEWVGALQRGDWEENGEPIIIADTGELNDGQHRLSAVVETGITMRTLVVFGVSRASRTTVDGGRKRTAAHVLTMGGAANAYETASSLKMILNLLDGLAPETYRTAPEIEAAFAEHPRLSESILPAGKLHKQFRQSRGLWIALHYLMAQRDRDAANDFFVMLTDGINLHGSHPATLWRRRFMKLLGSKSRLPVLEQAAITIKAWNMFRRGQTAAHIGWRSGGESVEPFPVIA